MITKEAIEAAEREFTEYFVRNYPGPDTIIFDPKWHAPKLFRAATHSLVSSPGKDGGQEVEAVDWRDGAPPKPWCDEWFIAETTYGDRVVLTALPKDWAYDFKTADSTYIKADKIKRWMQFPDSQFIAPQPASTALVEREAVADQIIGQIEDRFPNWRSYRDLIDCIDCTLHELRKDARS